MLITLKDLKPNPTRDFTVDPLDDERIQMLRKSIKSVGFWGGVVCRKAANGGGIQIGAGHHRIAAAIKEGIERAELYVAHDMDEAGLILVYARENATQRGNLGTAQAGTVAAAIKYLAKQVLTGTSPENRRRSIDTARGQLATERGLGKDLILEFLSEIPGITRNSIEQQLAVLKSSGDYARIIGEVQAEIEAENKEAIKEAERAERERLAAEEAAAKAEENRREAEAKAKRAKDEADKKRTEHEHEEAERKANAAKKRKTEAEAESKTHDQVRKTVSNANRAVAAANKQEITFDFEGVAKHLAHVGHLEAFRKCVTAKAVTPYLAVNKQAALAAHIVGIAKQEDAELTARFIADHVGALSHQARFTKRKLDAGEKQKMLEHSWRAKATDLQHHFARQCGGMMSAAMKLIEHEKQRPKEADVFLTAEFKQSVKRAADAIELIERKIFGGGRIK